LNIHQGRRKRLNNFIKIIKIGKIRLSVKKKLDGILMFDIF